MVAKRKKNKERVERKIERWINFNLGYFHAIRTIPYRMNNLFRKNPKRKVSREDIFNVFIELEKEYFEHIRKKGPELSKRLEDV